MRSTTNCAICCWNPLPISPIVFSTGTRHWSNISLPVSEARIPSLSRILVAENPPVSVGKISWLMPA